MEFVRNNLYWVIGGIIVVGLIVGGIIYYGTAPDGETKFVITPLDKSNILPYDLSEDSDWIGNYTKEFPKIVPPASSSPSVPTPTPAPASSSQETPWKQGPSEQEIISVPTPLSPLSPSQTPWEQGPSG